MRLSVGSLASLKVVLLGFLIQGCASKEVNGDVIEAAPDLKSKYNFYSPESITVQLRTISDLNEEANQQELVKTLLAFRWFKQGLFQSELILAPFSKTQLKISSFCASTGKAIPVEEEAFLWVKGTPKIQLLNEVLNLYKRRGDLSHHSIQAIIWNLENKTLYENYPENFKKILNEASGAAPLLLPSGLKTQITEHLTPDRIKDAISFVRGQYYSYEEIEGVLKNLESKLTLPNHRNVATLPDSNLLATTTSNGYRSQVVSLYNSSSSPQKINILNYYLRPYRSDVQNIALASIFPYSEEVQKHLEQSALKLVGYLGSQYPTLNKDEKWLVRERPMEAAIVFYNSIIAERAAENLFPTSKPNGESDAVRHYIWSGLLTRDLGEESARAFLDAHEKSPGQSNEEKEMDLFNNDQGILAANELIQKDGYFSNSTIIEKSKEALASGSLRVLAK